MSSPSPAPSQSQDKCHAPNPHVVLNLDEELVAQALVECLQLAGDLHQNPQYYRQLCPQLLLRLSYALLHSDAPEFRREELRRLALHHNRLATSLLSTQAVLGNLPRYLRRARADSQRE